MNAQIEKNTANPAGQVTIKTTDPDPEADLARDLLERARQAASERTPTLVKSGGSRK
jgi:hypothetical protein